MSGKKLASVLALKKLVVSWGGRKASTRKNSVIISREKGGMMMSTHCIKDGDFIKFEKQADQEMQVQILKNKNLRGREREDLFHQGSSSRKPRKSLTRRLR